MRKDKSVSILLEADPGVGKTYLAEKLSDQIKFPLIKHDISQMVQREELLDLFDMIAAKQAEQSLPVFVFIDEINASLGGSPVYGGFLAPLEAGKYMRRGRLYELKPCVWMFAGTPEKPSESEQYKEKLQDFKSRLTAIERIGYRSLQESCIVFDKVLEEKNRKENWKEDNWEELSDIIRKSILSSGLQLCQKNEVEKRLEEVKQGLDEKLRGICEIQAPLEEQVRKQLDFDIDELLKLDHQVRLEQVYMGAQ